MTEMGRLLEQYVQLRLDKGELSKDAAATYRSYLRAFSATYGDREIKKVTYKHVEKFLETRGHLARATRRSQFSKLRQFCRWLTREGHVRTNPMEDKRFMAKPPRPGRTPPRGLDVHQVATLLMTVPDRRARAIVALMVGCGLRCCEVSGLNIEHWDRRHNIIRVTGKGSSRYLPVPAMVVRYLNAYLQEFPAASGPLIRQTQVPWLPLSAKTLSKYVGQWMWDAGIKLSPRDGVSAHSLRHTAATDVLDRCGKLHVVQAMLGHESIATTEGYISLHRAKAELGPAMEGRDYSLVTDKADKPD